MKDFVKYKGYLTHFFLLLLIAILNFSCNSGKKSRKESTSVEMNDLKRIKSEGVLKAVVDYNSTNYFVYRGKPMGFKYELLQELCNELDVTLDIYVSNNMSETFDGLINGRFDLIAKNLTITKARSAEIDFTFPLEQTCQVLVQREKLPNGKDLTYVNSTLELAGKQVYVQKNTSFYRRLQNLSDEIGANIEIIEDSVFGVEQLVAKVAEGEIDYTVCDNNIAILNKTYYPNLDISMQISFSQNIAWAVRKGSDEWKVFLDKWIRNFKKTRRYRQLYYKYFESPRTVGRLESDFHSISGGKISKYDETIKELAKEHHWDWRLIASIIYHESRFNTDAGSWAGASGLMQLMPSTAQAFGIENYKLPRQNIKAGILFLNWLNNQFIESIPDSTERISFVLASYNIGLGHVKDAQRLAKKYGKNSKVWKDNVDLCLENKSTEKYYTDSVVRFGYCRGHEATNYVKRVTNNYVHYLNVIGE